MASHIALDSPVVLATTLLCLLVYFHTQMEPSALSRYYAWLPWRATSLSSPLTAWRLFSHSLGHGGWDHLQHNLMLLCLVGPPCERHYGSTAVFRVLVCCSVAVAISHWTLGPSNAQIFGLSGNVFALITLNGFAGFTGGHKAVPATAVLTMVLWLAGEIGPLLHGKADGISHASHLVGALFGSYCGYAVGQVPSRRSAFQELSGVLREPRDPPIGWNASAGDGEAREPRLSGASRKTSASGSRGRQNAVPSSVLRPSSPGAAAASLNPRVFGRREAERNAQVLESDSSSSSSSSSGFPTRDDNFDMARCLDGFCSRHGSLPSLPRNVITRCGSATAKRRTCELSSTKARAVPSLLMPSPMEAAPSFRCRPACLTRCAWSSLSWTPAARRTGWRLRSSVVACRQRGQSCSRTTASLAVNQVVHDNYFAAFGVPREWLPRILVFASHAWVSGYVLELRTDQNQKIDLRHGDSVQLRASKFYEVVLTPRERGGQKPCREAALDFLARPGQLHSVMYFRGEATGKEGLFLYPGDASAPGSAEAADPAPWRDCEDMSPAILESPWPRDHRNAQMGDRGLVLTNLFHLLDQDRNLLLDTSEQAQLLRHAPGELAGACRMQLVATSGDGRDGGGGSQMLPATSTFPCFWPLWSTRRPSVSARFFGDCGSKGKWIHPRKSHALPGCCFVAHVGPRGKSWGAVEGPNPACWSEALRYADCCDDKSNTTCWTQDYDWELCCAEPEPWQIWETPPPPEQPGGRPSAEKAPLSQLMLEAGSDKAQNGYCPIYEVLLQPLKVQRLLEVGLGTQNPDSLSSMAGLGPGFRPGGSLRAWRDYLPQAFIYGLDVMPDAMVRGEVPFLVSGDSTELGVSSPPPPARVRTALADSANEGHVASVMKSWGFASAPGPGTPRGVFDVVVDDGLHSPEAQIATLGSLWPWLKRGGIFVVEDINDGKPMLQRASAAIEGIVGKAPYFFVDNFLMPARFIMLSNACSESQPLTAQRLQKTGGATPDKWEAMAQELSCLDDDDAPMLPLGPLAQQPGKRGLPNRRSRVEGRARSHSRSHFSSSNSRGSGRSVQSSPSESPMRGTKSSASGMVSRV
eukprot:s2072_g7.t5